MALFADAPIEAPTVRGFVSLLLEGLNGATVEEVSRCPPTWSNDAACAEILGMLRVRGLSGVLRRIKAGGDPGRDRRRRQPAIGDADAWQRREPR